MEKILNIALAGNPNSGKTTIFNALTGSHQHVGNWPGVTVEKKEGEFIYNSYKVKVVDLPGIYSLTPYTIDEKIARDFIVQERPDTIVAIVDASNIERNFYLVTQILELGANLILDLNMIDLAEKKGLKIDCEKLSRIMGIPVATTIGNKSIGIEELKKTIIDSVSIEPNEFRINYGNDIEKAVDELTSLFKDKEITKKYPLRWFIIKLLERDIDIIKELEYQTDGKTLLDEVHKKIENLERHFGYDIETALIERRYGYIEGIIRECTKKELNVEKRHELSDTIDRIVTNKYLGIPIFLLIMWLIFQIIFKFGNPIADLIDTLFMWFGETTSNFIISSGLPEWFASFMSDGIIGGIGSILVFVPNIFLLFFVIALLEDSGYMARAAFVMDRIMHTLGLHGKSFIPLILGFGCNIPGIMATRTLETKKDRILTILIVPLMSCSARLPIYTLFVSVFFRKYQGLVVFSLYLTGIILAIIVARIFKSIFFKTEVAPLIMELPPYRMPNLRSALIHMWERGSMFLRKAGTVIFIGVIIIWALASLPAGVEYASVDSFIGRIGNFLAPLLKPAGFGFWQAAVALVFGIIAKELVVGTLGTLYSATGDSLKQVILANFNPVSAYAFMLMSLIYIPCIATIATIKKETDWKWTLLAISYTLILGWIVATGFFQIVKFI